MRDEEKQDKGFTVSDRRRFSVSESGEGREESKVQEEGKPRDKEKEPPQKKGIPRENAEAAGQKEAGQQKAQTPLPEIDFSTFVVSLSSSVLIHLGVVPDPMTREKKKDLATAKQTIDMLGMLQEKTRGNLSSEENQLLEGLLYDLRMRYVSESK
jgi:Domain of unknown function (DUF1844)